MQAKLFARFLMMLALASAITFAAGCGGDEDDDGSQTLTSFSVTITDQAGASEEWVATGVSAEKTADGGITITAEMDGETVALELGGDAVGVYTFEYPSVSLSNSTAHFLYHGGSPAVDYNAPTGGSVVIASYDTGNMTVSGTFETSVQHLLSGTTLEFSGGSFSNVPYTE